MSNHYNIQVSIQRVDVQDPVGKSSYTPRRTTHDEDEEPRSRKAVTEVASIKITAATEPEAFDKAQRLLSTLAPEPEHVHRASCDDAGGNHTCGYR